MVATHRHLIILCHGVIGSKDDWTNFCEAFHDCVAEKTGIMTVYPTETSGSHSLHTLLRSDTAGEVLDRLRGDEHIAPVHPSEGKYVYELFRVDLGRWNTLKGLECCSLAACGEVERYLSSKVETYESFSIIGHSLGGIYSKRMLVLRHHHQYPCFARLKPLCFITLASPHLSSLRRGTLAVAEGFTRVLVGTTGLELLGKDKERSLLKISEESVPHLNEFRKLLCYANLQNDYIVPHWTSIIQPGKMALHPSCAYPGRVIQAVHNPNCNCFARVAIDGEAHAVSTEVASVTEQMYQQAGPCFDNLCPLSIEGKEEMGVDAEVADELVVVEDCDGPIILRPPPNFCPAPCAILPEERAIEIEREQYATSQVELPGVDQKKSLNIMKRIFERAPKTRVKSQRGPNECDLLAKLYSSLNQCSWIRVDVLLKSLSAHEHIILKNYTGIDGREIVSHIVDNFVWQ